MINRDLSVERVKVDVWEKITRVCECDVMTLRKF